MSRDSRQLAVRAYRDEDFATVDALWRACDLVVPWNDPAADIALCRASPNADLLVCEADGRVVASVMVGHDGHRAWMYYLGVDPAYRGRGLGRRMVAEAEVWARTHGVPKIQLMVRESNHAQLGFYRHLGYQAGAVTIMQRWLKGERARDPVSAGSGDG